MSRAVLACVVVLSTGVWAQTGTADAGQPMAPTAGAAASPESGSPADVEGVKRDLDATRKELKDLREEMRAQLANQSAAQGWQEDWVPEKRKLETFVPSGYFRVRPELFHRMDLGRTAGFNDPSGYPLWPRSPDTDRGRTNAGVNMRLRFEPTLNVSEEVRVRMQIDALDNVLFGSSPTYAFSRTANLGYGWDRDQFSLFDQSQAAPRSGMNAIADSVAVKRVWGEVSTPVGIFRFGRMGSHWGLGMLHNDGNCLDCDYGDTVDRIMFVAEPLAGIYISPMLDFNVEGPSSTRTMGGGQPFDLSNSDDAHSLVIAIAKRDTDSQARAKLDSGQTIFNAGVHFTYRWQKNDPQDFYGNPWVDEGQATPGIAGAYVPRDAKLFIPDIWLKVERSNFRVELEGAAVLGDVSNRAQSGATAYTPGQNQSLGIVQFGGVLQAEYRLLDNALTIGLEVGFASGDEAPGFGNHPRRAVKGPDNNTQPGDIDGPQYACQSTGGCTDSYIRNFRFNQDYRVDLILYREILGGVTDSLYFKPRANYRIADGFNAFAAVVYSRAIYGESTPSAKRLPSGAISSDANLGIEIDLGARYETEDGFFGQLQWGILFPLGGMAYTQTVSSGAVPNQDSAQVLRGSIGIKF